MWSGNFKAALINLRMYKWRSIFTMLGIIVGVSSVVTVVSLGEGLKQQVVGQINQLGSDVLTVRSGKLVGSGAGQSGLNLLAFLSTSTLTDKDVETIGKLPSVEAVAPINFVTNTASTDDKTVDNLYIVGTSHQLDELLNKEVAYGTFFSSEPTGDDRYVVIGSKVAENLFAQLNPVGKTLKVSGVEYIVQGVLEPSTGGLMSIAQTDFNLAIFMPLEQAKALTGNRTNILQILAKSKDQNLDTTAADIERAVKRNHSGNADFSVLKQEELLTIANDVLNRFTGFIAAIAAVSLLVGGIGIMDIMLVSVSERTREIGIRKAIGATTRQIRNQFFAEGMLLSVGGGLIGIALSLLINLLFRIYTDLEPVINVPVLLLAVGISVAIGVIFAVAPAVKAARKNPIDALRNE